jgi:hypothetical protein
MKIINKILRKFGIVVINRVYAQKLIENQICLLELKKFIIENPLLFSGNSIIEELLSII